MSQITAHDLKDQLIDESLKGLFAECQHRPAEVNAGILWAKVAELPSQIRRLMAERDLLLGAIASEDYAKIKDQMVQVSESPDGVPR